MVREIAIGVSREGKSGSLFIGLATIHFALVVAVVVFGFTAAKTGFLSGLLSNPFLWIAPFIGLSTIHFARTGFQAFSRFRDLAIIGAVEKALQVLAVWALIGATALTAITAITACAAVSFIVAMVAIHSIVGSRLSVWPDLAQARKALSGSWRLFLSTAVFYFCSYPFLMLLCGSRFGHASAAAVAVGVTITGLLLQPVFWVVPTLLPHFSRAVHGGDDAAIRRYLGAILCSPLVAAAFAVAAIAAAILSPMNPLRHLGPGFETSAALVAVLLISALPEGVHAAINPILIARRREGIILLGAIARVCPFLAAAALARNAQELAAAYSILSWVTVLIELICIRSALTAPAIVTVALVAASSIALGLALAFAPGAAMGISAAICLAAVVYLLQQRRVFWAIVRGSEN
jgi:O-antigen/teichoic acid export membrane protein